MQVCPQCQSDRLVNNGSAAGKPKKLCQQCGYQLPVPPRAASPSRRRSMRYGSTGGISMNRVAFLLRVSAQAVLNWIRTLARSTKRSQSLRRSIILELDEMSLREAETAETLDLEGLRSGHGATVGLGM